MTLMPDCRPRATAAEARGTDEITGDIKISYSNERPKATTHWRNCTIVQQMAIVYHGSSLTRLINVATQDCAFRRPAVIVTAAVDCIPAIKPQSDDLPSFHVFGHRRLHLK